MHDAQHRTTAPTPVTGVEHWTTRRPDGDVRLFLWEKFVGIAGRQARGAVRARLVDGVAADVRPHGARPARLLGDGLVRAARLRLLVRRHGRLRPLRQDSATSTATSPTAPTTSPRPPTTSRARAACAAFMTYGISSGALRAALFAQRHPERVARLALDAFVWTGEGAPTLEQRRKKLPRVPRERSAGRSTARSSTRSSSATIRTAPSSASSTRSPTRSSRSTTRCPTAPTSTCARSCRSSIRRRSRADDRAARPVRRHRRLRRPDRVLQAAAESRQAVLGDGGHLARELPAEELPDGLSHPARVLHAARSAPTSASRVRALRASARRR